MPIERLLSREMIARRPDLSWKYLLQIEQACRAAKPNRGHEVIAETEAAFERVWVLTQNVDGFHRQTGSRNLIEIHGELHRVRCMRCAYSKPVADYLGFELPPRCPECAEVIRPDVVLFGERLPALQIATYEAEISLGFNLVFSVGTTSVFPCIAAQVRNAYRFGKPSAEINPGVTDVSQFVTVKLPLRAASALDAIWRQYNRSS